MKIFVCSPRVLSAICIAMMATSLFAPCEVFSLSSGPPSSGDWLVTLAESYQDEIIVLNGNLVIVDGGSLTFRNVTLQLNCTFDNHYGIMIQTGGGFYVLDGSIITSADPANRYSFIANSDSSFRMSYSELHHCGWNSSDWYVRGLYISSDDALVENCLISDNFFGICFESDVVIRNNNITRNEGSGINGGTEESNAEIYNNHVSLNNGSGISVGRCNASIYNNTVTSNSWAGINPHDSANPVIQNNVVMNNGGAGIFCVFNSTPTITNNVVAENLENGVVCHSYSSPTILNNTITSNLRWAGIQCSEYSNPLIQSNTITNNSGGVSSVDFCAPTILDNNISQNNGSAISLFDSNATIQNNVISLNEEGGIRSENSSLTVEGNLFSKQRAYDGAIACRFSSGSIRGNTFRDSDMNCITLYWSSPIIQGNNLTNNSGTGIWCKNHSNPSIQGNSITFNGGAGIGCNEESRPEIRDNDIYGQNHVGLLNEDDSVTVNATYNYWGSESGPVLESPDAIDPEEISGSVLYDPWLTGSIIVIEIADPLQGETVSSSVRISADAHAKNGISLVEFYIDFQLKYSDFDPPYDWDWDTMQYSEASHEITVKVIDNFCALVAHSSRTVIVDNTSPTASFEEPLPGNTCKGTVVISVDATDNREVSNVHFKVDTGTWLTMTYDSIDFLWKCDLNTTDLFDGLHTLMVLALDRAGNPVSTSMSLFTDNNPPTLTIQSPASGITVGLTLVVSVQASDVSNVSRIEFYLQDVLVYTVYNAPYQWSWDTKNYPNGDHTITVKAYDNAGNVKASETTVTVRNVELPWWQEHLWTIVQVLIGVGGLMIAILTFVTKRKHDHKDKD